MQLWKSLDQVEIPPVYLKEEDLKCCYFAWDYVSHGGFEASKGNSLVTNFKKPPERRSRPLEWRYRENALLQFAQELRSIVGDHCVTAVPSSRMPEDAGYDRRFEDLFDVLSGLRSNSHVEWPIRRKFRVEALHVAEVRRKVHEVYASLEWVGFRTAPKSLIIVDDVITCGTHYKACQRLLREHCPDLSLFGVFWARTVWPETELQLRRPDLT